jgi:hypothetical protein
MCYKILYFGKNIKPCLCKAQFLDSERHSMMVFFCSRNAAASDRNLAASKHSSLEIESSLSIRKGVVSDERSEESSL